MPSVLGRLRVSWTEESGVGPGPPGSADSYAAARRAPASLYKERSGEEPSARIHHY